MAKKRKKPKKQPKKQPKKKRAQKPPPTCKALLLCDKTIIEAVTDKVSIIGVFDALRVPSVPGKTPPFTVFIQLTDGIGRYDVVIEIHDLAKDVVLGRGTGIGLNWPQKLLKLNVMIPCPPIPVARAGLYDLVVIANGEEIDRQKFAVIDLSHGDGDEDEN